MTVTLSVQVLSGVVTTLIVGAGRITLDEVRQLDVVGLGQLQVLGRVHITAGDIEYAIGLDPDGILSLARIYEPDDIEHFLSLVDFAEPWSDPALQDLHYQAALSPLILLAGARP